MKKTLAGLYSCVVQNKHGKDSVDVELIVKGTLGWESCSGDVCADEKSLTADERAELQARRTGVAPIYVRHLQDFHTEEAKRIILEATVIGKSLNS